jgi:hypothetical protein
VDTASTAQLPPPALASPGDAVPDLGLDRLGWRPFLVIVCAFWLYATVSAVLYAYGMDASFASMTAKPLFASWRARVLQHLLLLPPLLGCYRLSLRLAWQPLGRRLAAQIGLGTAFALLARPALWAAMELVGESEKMDHENWLGVLGWIDAEMMTSWLASFTDFLVRYGFGLALVTGFAVYKRYRDSEIRLAALEQQWGAARLAALRMQLSPHTLFNLLHTIRGQIAWDPAAAQAMVIKLADLLRRLLNAGERDFSRLADELQFVRLYLELQLSRFTDRLSISLPGVEGLPEVWVPSLILQPLVENAVVHGLAGHDGPVRVEIAVRIAGEELHLRVTNPTAAGPGTGREGIGLRNVRERLAVQFGERARLAAGPDGPATWAAEIVLPLSRESPQPGNRSR